MRKKTGNSLDVAAISSAWEEFFQQNKTNTIESLRKEGWLSIMEISSKLNKSRMAVKRDLQKKGIEYKQFSVPIDGVIRCTGFFRIKK